MKNRLTPNPQIVVEHQEGHLSGGGLPGRGMGISPTQPWGPLLGRGVPTTSGSENRSGLCPSG